MKQNNPPIPSPLDPTLLQDRIERLLNHDGPRYRLMWAYYRNPMLPVAVVESQGSERPYRQAQEWGLPPRITGRLPGPDELSPGPAVEGVARKEIVIENDLGWRIETMIDYLVGKPLLITSTATDPSRREQIETLLRAVLVHNGGIVFMQHLALLGAIYGFVDVMVKLETRPDPVGRCEPSPDGAGPSAGPDALGSLPPQAESAPEAGPRALRATCNGSPLDDPSSHPGASKSSRDAALERIARMVRLEIIEPARALPLLSPTDWKTVDAYVQVCQVPREAHPKSPPLHTGGRRGLWQQLFNRIATARRARPPGTGLLRPDEMLTLTEIVTAHQWRRYADQTLIAQGSNALGAIPLVHIQNIPIPFEYAGGSDLEPLIPLQDELNTRLCDRAHRITMQSFKMYLGKGIDNFTSLPVAPGRMWMTDNDDASVIEFGGDSACPSEDRHILELREALDKTSGVTPIAAGAIKGRIGHLTSAAALRVTMMALLARTERKRTVYGEAIQQMCRLSLAWLDRAGLFQTGVNERHVEVHWPNPLPANEIERLEAARLKRDLGIPHETVLRELGY
jgi:hypothetical protein